ncbi:nucleoid-associated protein [Halomonas sp. LR5S13]|uniref:nucleoid-associated protein n=1 Tax=Halomonas rhizosphaerae TaxID=3043296 RepID=UPI0024A89260|nr:nucleoid-associated protein [Halomonas rhizosphaerae]MDI5921167.1 nucleoid-associated protein [Halomonas rhizosphaerae]
MNNVKEEQSDKKVHVSAVRPIRAVTGLLRKGENPSSALFQSKLGKPWDVSDKIAIEFVNEIERRFRSKNKKFGYFSSKMTSIPRELKRYYESNDNSSDAEFMSFSDGLMTGLASAADEAKASPTAGGNVVIMHYSSHEEGDLGRLLVMLLEKRGMFDFDSDLRPERLEPIDTKAIKQAALIDINLFSVCYPSHDGEAYLRFIEGSSRADFFKTSFGCSESVDNKRSVEELDRALGDFIEAKRIGLDLAEELREGVKALLLQHSKPSSEPLSLDKIQKRLDQILPEESEHKGLFSGFVNDNEYQVNDWFSPTNYSAKKVGKILLEDENKSYDVEVSENSIGEMDSTKPVKVSEDGNYLCFPISGEKRREVFRVTGRSMSDDDGTA